MAWPKDFPILSERQVVHGSFIISPIRVHSGRMKYACGTRCCARGWIALAFNEDSVYYDEWGPEARAFAKTLVRVTGRSRADDGFGDDDGRRAEAIFEGWDGYVFMSKEEFAACWNKAAAEHGYDVRGAK